MVAFGVNECYGKRSYLGAPIYSLALLDGFGQMGNNAHWFSDAIGAALLSAGTTELFLWPHKRHQADSSRDLLDERAFGARVSTEPSIGMRASYSW